MQKFYTPDFLSKSQIKNDGELDRYYVKGNHEGIISREDWDAAQLELERRKQFRERHGIRTGASVRSDPFFSKVFCGKCGGKLIRKDYKGIKGPYWKCGNSKKDKDKKCKEELIREGALESAAVEAWNRGIEKNAEKWNRAAVEGNALERYRARLMIAVAAEGKMEVLGDEMTRMFLEEIVVISPTELVVKFLDGSKESISIP